MEEAAEGVVEQRTPVSDIFPCWMVQAGLLIPIAHGLAGSGGVCQMAHMLRASRVR